MYIYYSTQIILNKKRHRRHIRTTLVLSDQPLLVLTIQSESKIARRAARFSLRRQNLPLRMTGFTVSLHFEMFILLVFHHFIDYTSLSVSELSFFVITLRNIPLYSFARVCSSLISSRRSFFRLIDYSLCISLLLHFDNKIIRCISLILSLQKIIFSKPVNIIERNTHQRNIPPSQKPIF